MVIYIMKEKDSIDKEIWVENRIEEAKEEIEEKLNKKIKELKYEETIKNLNNELEKINKDINQVDYNKDRAIELLEEDLTLKINDIKIVEDNILEEKVSELIENIVNESKKEQDKKINEIKNTLNSNVDKYKKEIIDKYNTLIEYAANDDGEQDKKFKKLQEELNGQIDKITKETRKQYEEDIDRLIDSLNEQMSMQKEEILSIIYATNQEDNKIKKIKTKKASEIKNKESEQVDISDKTNIGELLSNLDGLEQLIDEKNNKNLKVLKRYVESEFLRMRYTTTIQGLKNDIAVLKKEMNNMNKNDKMDIDAIIEKKVHDKLVNIYKKNGNKKQTQSLITIDDILLKEDIQVKTENKVKKIANTTNKIAKLNKKNAGRSQIIDK